MTATPALGFPWTSHATIREVDTRTMLNFRQLEMMVRAGWKLGDACGVLGLNVSHVEELMGSGPEAA